MTARTTKEEKEMKSIHAPSGASFLEELKAAQKVIDKAKANDWSTDYGVLKLEGKYWAIDIGWAEEDHIRNVLRRIPQLIEAVDYLQQQKDSSEEAKENFNDFHQDTIIIDLVSTFFSKLEGKKDE